MVLNMFPTRPMFDAKRGLFADAKFRSDRSRGLPGRHFFAHFYDIFLGKLGLSVSASALYRRAIIGIKPNNFPAFFYHVASVFEHGSSAKVSGVYARRIITLMQNAYAVIAFALWDFTKGVLVRKSVGKALGCGSSGPEKAVSMIVFVGGPQPTIIGAANVNFRPKAFCKHDDSLWVTLGRRQGECPDNR